MRSTGRRRRPGGARPVPRGEVRALVPGPARDARRRPRRRRDHAVSGDGGLPKALDALGDVAVAAGLDRAEARAEGAALAAALAESAPRAAQAWADELDSTVQAFFDAAVRARRWRQSPTTQLGELVAEGSPHAPDYARALVEVASAACTLGEPTITWSPTPRSRPRPSWTPPASGPPPRRCRRPPAPGSRPPRGRRMPSPGKPQPRSPRPRRSPSRRRRPSRSSSRSSTG